MPARMLLFGLTMTAVMGGTAAFLGWRLITPFRLGSPWNLVAWLLLVALVVVMPASFWIGRTLEGQSVSDLVQWAAFLAMGLVSFLWAFVVVRDGLWWTARAWDLVASMASLPRLLPLEEATRANWLARSNLAILALSAILLVWGFGVAAQGPRVRSVDLEVEGLPPSFHGYRIAQLSDIHLSPTIRGGDLARWVQATNGLSPDMVAITGDLVDGTVEGMGDEALPLTDLKAPDGVYFSTGNHEYYWGPQEWTAHLSSLGIRVLQNSHEVVRRGEDALVVAGINDHRAGDFHPSWAPDPVRAFQGAPEGATRLVLAHQPRSAPAVAAAGAHVQLSGHTHGGQFFPWSLVIHAVEPFVAGTYQVGAMALYVSRGTGWWGPPLRLGSRPEITLITLRPSDRPRREA